MMQIALQENHTNDSSDETWINIDEKRLTENNSGKVSVRN